ncbi:MAG: ATP-binding protein [Deltaproteobacteria bacterium]|jgi:hypothetical protein|nr:ATP-binding protein [Deltaproteobacteria bacterium]
MISKPTKRFNTVGVCKPADHYMIPPLPRLPDVNNLIDDKFYFVLHAPRQSGKTTCLEALTEKINSEGQHYAVNCSLDSLRNIEDDLKAMDMVTNEINAGLGESRVPEIRELAFSFDGSPYRTQPNLKVRYLLRSLCRSLDRELIVFFDEADCLHENPLVMFLVQIRAGYLKRSDSPETMFPRSLALVGMRDIRDYLYRIRPEERSTGLGSPFNVREESLTLADFTFEEIGALYWQHTEETGQIFEPGAVERVWFWTEGQPWLVNALADDVIYKRFKKDYSRAITGADIDQSARNLILRNPPHFDSLLERLKEPRVRRVIEPVITGAGILPGNVPTDDAEYTIDLGLLKGNPDDNVSFRASNPIYGEVIVRALTRKLQKDVPPQLANRWMDGTRLDMDGLLRAFQLYWRTNANINEKSIGKSVEEETQDNERIDRLLSIPDLADKYKVKQEIVEIISKNRRGFSTEDIPHNVLNAFLQRVLNGGADFIQRECALGRTRADICVSYKGIYYPLELKIKGAEALNDSLKQLSGYMDKCGATVGWLIVFDLYFKKLWRDKQFWDTQSLNGHTIHVVGC